MNRIGVTLTQTDDNPRIYITDYFAPTITVLPCFKLYEALIAPAALYSALNLLLLRGAEKKLYRKLTFEQIAIGNRADIARGALQRENKKYSITREAKHCEYMKYC